MLPLLKATLITLLFLLEYSATNSALASRPLTTPTDTSFTNQLLQLQRAYPNFIRYVDILYIVWTDGTHMSLADKQRKSNQEKLQHPSLRDQMDNATYQKGKPIDFAHFQPTSDPGRIRYQPFFMKMYGQSKKDVQHKLTLIYWMPRWFGNQYPLLVTTVNGIDKKLALISDELELLVFMHPSFRKFLDHPGGTFNWRRIAHTQRQSLHSYGIAIDINPDNTSYWETDLEKNHQPISEKTRVTYRNTLPWDIVNVFEKHGFIWGGKWYHYDTMHFEYRPELYGK